MAYQVTARKWRPQNFDEVVYQDHVSRTIRNSIKNGRISHAYLFAGPRGVGKTTMARILAKSLNCVHGPTESPCGKCEQCLEIRDGASFDVIEIDGASNRGIENIRELRENVNFAPVKSKYKIYIIDEVHMLTKEAFNALLKTLEEPPPHVVFVFATTEIHQVPETILSRCQKFFFKKISVDAIVAHLKSIVKKEGFAIDEAALYPIARAAGGSMRDSQSLLDQVISFSEGDVSEANALAVLGIVPVESYLSIFGHIAGTDAAGVITETERVASLGLDLPRYAAGFIEILRTIRLLRNGIELADILGFSAEETDKLKSTAALFSDEELGSFFRIASELQAQMRFTSNEQINIEMALLDMISVRRSPSIAALLKKLENVPEPVKEQAPAKPQKTPEKPVEAEKKNDPPADFRRQWTEFLTSVKDRKPLLFRKLKDARVTREGNDILVSPSPTRSPGGMLDRNDLDFISGEFSRMTGSAVSAKAPAEPPAKPQEPVRESTPPPEAEMVRAPEPDTSEMDSNDPLVEKIKEIFHGQIIETKGE